MTGVVLPTCVTSSVQQVPGLTLPSPEIREAVFDVTSLGLGAGAKLPALSVAVPAPAVIDVNDLDHVMLGIGAEGLTGSGQGGEDWMTQCLDFGDLMRFAEVPAGAQEDELLPKKGTAKRRADAQDVAMESSDSLGASNSEDDAVAARGTASHGGGRRKRNRVTAARSRDAMDKKMERLDKRNAELKAAISDTQGEIDQVVRLMRLILKRRRNAARKA